VVKKLLDSRLIGPERPGKLATESKEVFIQPNAVDYGICLFYGLKAHSSSPDVLA